MAEGAAAIPTAPSAEPAPSPGAPTARPVAGPDTQTVNALPGDPVGTVPKAGTGTRAKPIPGPRLPGVFPDDDPFPSAPSRSASPSADPAVPSRGPDGRFVASPSSATPPGDHPGEHTLEPAATPLPKTPPARFKFAGEEFDTQELAEQNFRSLRGQFKPVTTLAQQLGGMEKIVPEFHRAAESARGWKAEAERLTAELTTLRGQPANPTPPSTPSPDAPAADAAAADVDWDLYAEVERLATESGEPWKAKQWLIEQVRKADEARYQRMLDERLAPLDEQQRQADLEASTATLFGSLQGYTLADGSLAFPELHDEASAEQVARLWATSGLPAEAALTPQGAIAAVALYRMLAGKPATPQASSAPAAAPAAPPAPPAPTDAHAAAGLDDGRPTVASVPGNGSAPSPEATRILAALRQSRTGARAHLGFEA